MNELKALNYFHDWYLIGAEVDETQRRVVLNVLFDTGKIGHASSFQGPRDA